MRYYVETFQCYSTYHAVDQVLLKYYSAENKFLQWPF